jgi:hypothetical protein
MMMLADTLVPLSSCGSEVGSATLCVAVACTVPIAGCGLKTTESLPRPL